jgi:hypothetical protein
MKNRRKYWYEWGRRNIDTIIIAIVFTVMFLGMIFLSKG